MGRRLVYTTGDLSAIWSGEEGLSVGHFETAAIDPALRDSRHQATADLLGRQVEKLTSGLTAHSIRDALAQMFQPAT